MRTAYLKKLLQELNTNSISYAILRNYEFLYDTSYPVESLDTLVATKDFPKLKKILKNNGFTPRTQQFSRKHKSFFKLIDGKKVSFDIQVGGIHWNDLEYLNEEILQKRQLTHFFYTLSDYDYCLMLIVHSILGKRKFKIKYQKLIVGLLPKVGKIYLRQQLSSIFSTDSASEIIDKIKEGKFDLINSKKLVKQFIFKKPARVFTLSWLSLRWFKQKKLKVAPLISVLGPDGSGKSSAVKALVKYLEANDRKITTVYSGRGRGNILPGMGLAKKYKGREKKKDKVSKNSSGIKRKVLYTVMAPVYTLDLLLRYYLKILPQRLKGTIVITDRFGSDIILMKNLPFWYKRILYSLFPKPTISILMHNTPEVLNSRRPEETIEELQRQMLIFPRFKYSLVIKSEDEKKDTKEILDYVFTELLRNWH